MIQWPSTLGATSEPERVESSMSCAGRAVRDRDRQHREQRSSRPRIQKVAIDRHVMVHL